MPLRVLNLLAQNNVVVERAALDLDEHGYRIRLETGPVPAARCERIVENIRAMVLVRVAELIA